MFGIFGRIVSFYASMILFYAAGWVFMYVSTFEGIDLIFGIILGTTLALIGLLYLVTTFVSYRGDV